MKEWRLAYILGPGAPIGPGLHHGPIESKRAALARFSAVANKVGAGNYIDAWLEVREVPEWTRVSE